MARKIIVLIQNNHVELGGGDTPSPYGEFIDAISMLSLDLVQMMPADCMVETSWSHYDSLLMETLVPIVALVCILGTVGVQKARGKEVGADLRTYIGYFVVVLLLGLPTISRRVFQTFQVRKSCIRRCSINLDY